MSTDPKNLVGTTLSGRYRVERPIGEGGMGAVFEATQLSLGRRVAIKVVKPASAGSTDEEVMKRFERETEVISRLNHPNIVQVVDGGRADDGIMYLAMELLDGESVRTVLRHQGSIEVSRALSIVEDVLSALVAAHGGGVIHRDLKAENVMLVKAAGKSEIAKVLDFGVAKVTTQTEAPAVTGSGFVAGTPGCIAPEQMLGKNDDPRSDLYSLGVLLFEMLTGQGPFIAGNAMELMMKHLTETPPRVADVARGRGRAEVPGPVDELVASLLSKDPSMRPASAHAALQIVRSLQDAGRSTQPDVRMPLPTPQGAFAVGSRVVALPGTPAAQPAPPLPGSAPTSPTTAMPVPAAKPGLTNRQKGLRAAAAVVFVGLAAWGVGMFLSWDAERFSTDGDVEEEIARAVDAYKTLDIGRARTLVNEAIARDPDGAAMAYLLRGSLALVDETALSRIDADLGRGLEVATSRGARMIKETHLEAIAKAMAITEQSAALAAFQLHVDKHGCFRDAFHYQMFAFRYGVANPDQATVERLLLQEDSEVNGLDPVTVFGVARSRYRRGDFAGARAFLEDHAETMKPVLDKPVVVHLLADLDLVDGNVREARARLEALKDPTLKTRLRVALLKSQVDADAKAEDWTKFDEFISLFYASPNEWPERVDGYALLGHLYASAGRIKEANALWNRALDEATKSNDTVSRRLEVIAFAELFSVMLDELAVADEWRKRYETVSYSLPSGSTAGERLRAVALGSKILIDLATTKDAAAADQALQVLDATRGDIPIIKPAVRWHVLLQQGKLDDADAVAAKLPPCWGMPYRARVAVERLRAASTSGADEPATKDLREKAREALLAASSDEMRNRCTSSFEVQGWLQSVVYAKALGSTALVAEDLDAAARIDAVKRFRAHWRFADPGVPIVKAVNEIVSDDLGADAPVK